MPPHTTSLFFYRLRINRSVSNRTADSSDRISRVGFDNNPALLMPPFLPAVNQTGLIAVF